MADPGTAGPSGEEDQSPPKVSAGPKSAARTPAARPKSTAPSSQGAPKAAEGEAAAKGGAETPAEETVGVSGACPAQQLSQPIGAKHQSPLGSQAGSPGGAREQLSLPSGEASMAAKPKPLPAEGQPPPKRRKGAPEGGFTPPAVAGVPPQESQGPEISDQMKVLISEAIAQGIAAGLQQRRQAAPGSPETPQHEEQQKASPRKLFHPSLFKSLLLKAKATTGMGVEPALDPVDPNELLFSQPTIESEEISPDIFRDLVQKQCAQPGVCPPLNDNERRFYNVTPDFSEALELPTIDGPVAALVSSPILPSHEEDALNPGDKPAERTLRKVHKTAAMAIKTSTTAAFFNKASLMWLRQIQARVPPGDLRFHQDMNKVIAATEFSADATLTAAKFASRALSSLVVARRLLWLRYWKADMKNTWNLASAPYKGGKLFGEALERLLVERKDGRKILPSLHRLADCRGKNFRGASFRPPDMGFDAPRGQRPYTHRPGWEPDGSEFKDRNRGHFRGKRTFQGRGRRPFHRSK